MAAVYKFQVLYTKGGPATWNSVCACEYVLAKDSAEAIIKGKRLAVGHERVAQVHKVMHESRKP